MWWATQWLIVFVEGPHGQHPKALPGSCASWTNGKTAEGSIDLLRQLEGTTHHESPELLVIPCGPGMM